MLGGDDARSVLPEATLKVARTLRNFIAENAKSARRFLKAAGHPLPMQDVQIHVLDEHTNRHEVESLLALLVSGMDCGLVSEAGCPAVADPGALLVLRAHESGVRVVPLAGPSSILLALMASGMNGQRFTFHGYLTAERRERVRQLQQLETRAHGETQIFIETPYRNAAMLQSLLEHCRDDTLLGIAADLTLATEFVATRRIGEWKKQPPILDRRPAVFLIYRESH